MTGLETMSQLASRPFRFIYVSGSNATRDQSKKPMLMPEYSLLRVSPPYLHTFPQSRNVIPHKILTGINSHREKSRIASCLMPKNPKVPYSHV